MAFVRINGVLLHHRVTGPVGAPVMAFANSLGTDFRIWDGVVEKLADHYRLVTYDKRGHGLSDAPPGDYALTDHVADLAGLLDHLGVERTTLCGVSIGGLIVQAFALAHPERVAHLILCDTAARFGQPASWTDRMDAIRTGGMVAIADAVMDRWFSPGFSAEQPDARAGWRNLFLRSDVEGYAATCATLRDADLSAEIGRIDCPTLVIGGSADGSTPPEQVRALADAIPRARFALIEGAGHIPSIEQPDVLAGLIATFLEEARDG